MRTLWVEGSPKGERSLSSELAQAWLDAAGPDAVGTVERFSVWSDELLRVGRDAAIAKFAPLFGEPLTPAESAAWDAVLAEIARVDGFDRVVVSSPMWNWHVPHALKGWIDIIVQPVASFTLDEQGRHVGTLGKGRPLQLILTRSSAYDGSSPELEDFQRPYLEYVFGLLGYAVDTFAVDRTTRWRPESRERMRTQALAAVRAAATAAPAAR